LTGVIKNSILIFKIVGSGLTDLLDNPLLISSLELEQKGEKLN
jgi:hypothetical protein